MITDPTPTTHPHLGRARAFVAGLAVLLLVAGCSSSSSPRSSSNASPEPGGQTASFEPPALDGVPVPSDATAFGPAHTHGSTASQSYHQVGVTAEEAIRDYVTLATDAGWTVAEAPAPSGTTDWRAVLARDNRTLAVSTAPAPNATDGGVELSLQATTS